MKTLLLLLVVLCCLSGPRCLAQPTHGEWGDQGDGTYANPVLPADFSDLDAICVGSDFYAISSTFQYSPGMAVLHSRDLVNWTIVGHVVPDLTRISPALGWQQMDRAGRGIWAGSIRFHGGRFWVYFGTPDEGLFMSTAPAPSGPWTPVERVLAEAGWDDPCPFWDDDGQPYLVATRFRDYTIHLFPLSPDGRTLGTGRIIHHSKGSEANKLYKMHGLYYHYFSEVHAEGRVAMMERARSLDGPWQTRQLNHVHPAIDKEPNQGGLVELPSGKWYFFTHQGTGDWEGRAAVLLPVTWRRGWPILGRVGKDGIGTMVWRGPKPIAAGPPTSPVISDDFSARALDPAWEWNYQPREDHWSLTERLGWLRLSAFPPLRAGDFRSVGNVLTQRAMRTRSNVVTVRIDLSGMVDGQEAGLAHYARTAARVRVLRSGSGSSLAVCSPGCGAETPLVQKELWLRSTWDFSGLSRFSYSLDGQAFTAVGAPYRLTWGDYRGDRIGLYTTGERDAGHVDFTGFTYSVAR